jgi:hypothetical protein
MHALPDFVPVGDRQYEVIVTSRVAWFGTDYDARVCHRSHRVLLSASVPEADRPALLHEARQYLASQWHPV